MPIIKTIGSGAKTKKSNERWNKDPFYNKQVWRKTRNKKISIDPLCEVCMSLGLTVEAYLVDHHKPRRLWPELSLTINNLTSMCSDHHNKKSNLERKAKTKMSWHITMKQHKLYYNINNGEGRVNPKK